MLTNANKQSGVVKWCISIRQYSVQCSKPCLKLNHSYSTNQTWTQGFCLGKQ